MPIPRAALRTGFRLDSMLGNAGALARGTGNCRAGAARVACEEVFGLSVAVERQADRSVYSRGRDGFMRCVRPRYVLR